MGTPVPERRLHPLLSIGDCLERYGGGCIWLHDLLLLAALGCSNEEALRWALNPLMTDGKGVMVVQVAPAGVCLSFGTAEEMDAGCIFPQLSGWGADAARRRGVYWLREQGCPGYGLPQRFGPGAFLEVIGSAPGGREAVDLVRDVFQRAEQSAEASRPVREARRRYRAAASYEERMGLRLEIDCAFILARDRARTGAVRLLLNHRLGAL